MTKLIINTDGASRNNPGAAAASYVIQNEESKLLFTGGQYLGIATNNEAEYWAVKLALEKVKNDFSHILPATIEIRADSLLVVQQLAGVYKIKNERLKVLFNQIKDLEKVIGSVFYIHIPREQNAEADKQANFILDNVAGN